jgi:SWIM zinc finger
MTEQAGTELLYRYATPSQVRRADSGSVLLLGTSGGTTTEAAEGLVPHPYFFKGFLTQPAPAAAGMLACAAVARARYYHAPGSLIAKAIRDPVVTSDDDRLRFESFSGCCGVHARLDLLPAALDEAPRASGTANVDFNQPMRAALAGAAAGGPVLLSVGTDEVAVTTTEGSVTERRVPLPSRWLKGFGEVQALAVGMTLVAELSGPDALRFIRGIPRQAGRPLWAVPAGRTLALAASPRPGAACLSGPQRLTELGPLLRFARGLRAYSPATDARSLPLPSAWELDLGTARLTLTLSPGHSRGFSGEGALLGALADDGLADDAGLLSALLAWSPRVDVGRLAAATGLSPERTVLALTRLAASGRVGYDLAEQSFFHRELPFGPALEKRHPRLAAARALVASGAVTPHDGGASVGRGDGAHRVTFAAPYDVCTCPWWGRHRGTRGPCKHVLAARMAERTNEP